MRFLLLLLTVFVITGCAGEKPPSERYEARGQVVGFAFGGEAVVVEHEDIPGYMEAMRMTLRPEDRSLIAGLEPGDMVAFRLVVPEVGSPYLDRVELLPADTELDRVVPLDSVAAH